MKFPAVVPRSRALQCAALASALALASCGSEADKPRKRRQGPVPVEVADVTRGPIELRRTFAGSVRAKESFVVAADVSGRVQRLLVDLADPVERGQVVAELDDQEDAQGVSQASAELAVARANLAAAQNALVIAERELARVRQLHAKAVLAPAELDRATDRQLAAAAAVEVAQAQEARSQAGLKSARIRSNYNKVVATWAGDDSTRFVSQRSVAAGDRVTAGQPLFTVVDLAPIVVVINAGEKDYGNLQVGQEAVVTTDAYPDEELVGTVRRIAPVFRESSRQARVELELANERHLLKPGMFVRARVALRREPSAVIVPVAALTTRGEQSGVFAVDKAGERVTWRPVTLGIRQDARMQITGQSTADLVGARVVVLGHQLVKDNSPITIPGTGSSPQRKQPASSVSEAVPAAKRPKRGASGP